MNTTSRLRARFADFQACLLLSVAFWWPIPCALGTDTNAVSRGLSWLAAQQRANGSWSDNVALNALPMLAFLSAGETTHPVLKPGLDFLLTQQGPAGEFTAGEGMMYGHGLSTLLLAELVGLTDRDEEVRTALQKSIALILRSQAVPKADLHAGGWRYEPGSVDSDLSVTVWQITALKAASEVGVAVPRSAIERAVAYVKRCEHPRGGFGYQPGGLPNQARTAMAIVALQLCGQPRDPAIARARSWLESNPLHFGSPFFYYAAHHCAQARVSFTEQDLLTQQQADGRWPASRTSADEKKAGPLYTTSLAILALTAKDDYLPAYLW